MERGIDREGLADTLIVNPITFDNDDELPNLVREWLASPDFAEDPIETTREGLFNKLTSNFTDAHWRFLEVMMVLSRGTTTEVDISHVRTMLSQMPYSGGPHIESELRAKTFLHLAPADSKRGIFPACLTSGFIDLIGDELQRRGRTWPKSI